MTPDPRARTAGLAVGVGLRPGTPADAIEAAVRELVGESVIRCLATVDRRADEPGLRTAAARLGVPVRVFTAEQLADVAVPNPSMRTATALGTPSVAEAAALLAAESADLTLPKQIARGITIAAASFAHPPS
ncbi:cobalamin biosynthesis protein [Nocardia inohanensis]|uniref:cobalamin biosynthesis protein n=1 Tax=Nocardia inohanensis TaxID=209246 RepID=UPI00082EEC54|nr:cobalamin biosynthesis protein [Nocardia inohanensis]